jgi:hypothetical protein
MESTKMIWAVHPGNLKGANTIGAVTTLTQGSTQSYTPIIVTTADIIDHTGTMTTALVVTGSINSGGSSQKENSFDHFEN